MSQSIPVFTSVSYDGQQLSAQWQSTPPNGFTGYQVTLTENSGTGEVFPVSTTSFKLQRILTPTSTYTLQVATLVSGQAPICSSLVTLVTQTPALTSLSNSGSQVIYQWSAASGAGVEGYIAGLSSPATNWNNTTDATTLTTTFTQTLAATGTCTGWVRGSSSDGVVLGPVTAIRTLVTQTPALTSLSNSGSQVIYQWSAASGAGVEGYIAGLSSPATNWNNTTDATTLTTTFTETLAAAGICTGWVRGSSSDGVVLGPSSLILTLLTQPPVSPMLGYTGTALRLSWLPSGEANISGYSVELLANGGSSETDTPTVSPQTFAASFTSGIVFTAQVRSIGPNTKGPWSTLASGPYQADIVYTYDALGRLGSVAWDAGFTEAYGFDSTGNLLSATYPATQP
jgi:hypothetical protein